MSRTLAAFAAASLGLLAIAPALAASDYLLELEGVEGESTVKTTIALDSWSFGASNPTSVGSGGMSSGRRQHSPIRLAAPLAENGSVQLVTAAREAGSGMATGRSACAAGVHFHKATLRHAGRYWILTDVTVSSCASDGMSLTYRTSVAGYDLKASKK
jgi:hypothetical protein